MSVQKQIEKESLVEIKRLSIEGEDFFCISHHDAMRPFFMSIVSDSHHWMFISSNGGLSAGRKNAEHALFPYYTADKITESYDTTDLSRYFKLLIRVRHLFGSHFLIAMIARLTLLETFIKIQLATK
jgi:hypothetical protein